MAKKLSLIFLLVFLSGVVVYVINNAPRGAQTVSQGKADPKIEKYRLVNINTAGEAELETLPSIGPSTAKKIIEYRTQKGSFKTLEDLKKVKGIGEKTFERLKERITAE